MTSIRRSSKHLLLLGACLMPAVASGQEAAGDESAGIADIVVTAQKRAQSVQDVSISMSVLDASALDRQGVTNVQDIALVIPNTQVNSNFGALLFNVRGIGTDQYSVNLDSPVAIHLDEVYLSKSFMTGLLLFDIERVEALKGPQGTIFGRNTTGGAVNFYSRRPTDEFGAGGSLSYDNYETVRGEAFVNTPLTESLSARLSGMYVDQNQGFYKNITRGDTEGRERKFAARGQLRWKGLDTTALLSVHYGRDRSINAPSHTYGLYTPESLAAGAPILCREYLNGTVRGDTANCVRGIDGDYPRSSNPFISNGGTKNSMRGHAFGTTARIDHSLGSSTLTWISSYQHYLRDEQHDAEGGPIDTIAIYNHNKINQFTQEIRLTSNGDNRWNYVIGAFYEHDRYTNRDTFSIAGGSMIQYTDYVQKLDSFAVFAHNAVELTETLNLIAGVRFSRDRTSIHGGTFVGHTLIGDKIQRPAVITGTLAISDLVENGGRRADEDVSYKTGFEWRPRTSGVLDDALVYGHISTGYRAGSFNAEFTATQDAFTSLKPEHLTAYEVGFKTSLASRVLQMNGAFFRYDFKDGFLNVNLPNSVLSVVTNAAAIRSTGAELDLKWRAGPGLQLDLNAGWLDARIKSDVALGTESLKGNRPVNAPKWTFGAGAFYKMPLTDTVNLEFGANGNYKSSQYMSTVNRPSNQQDGFWVVNAQLALADRDSRWRLSGWVRNLTNARYRTFVNDVPGYGVLNIFGRPRVYGVTGSFEF